jgi:hypothetical protein
VNTSSVVGVGLIAIEVTTEGVPSCATAALARSSNVGKMDLSIA